MEINKHVFALIFTFTIFYIGLAQNYSALSIPEELKKNADAVVRLDEVNVNLTSINKMQYSARQIVTVLNKVGDQHASLTVGYDKERKIRDIEAIIYDAFGNEVKKIKKKDFNDYAAIDGFSLYTDNRILAYRYVPVDYPYTISFSYEIETSDTATIPNCYFIPGFDVGVEKSKYRVQYSSEDLKPAILESNLQDFEIEKQESPGVIDYRANALAPIRGEAHCPSIQKIGPVLYVATPKFSIKGHRGYAKNWNDIGVWMNTLLAGQDKLEPETINKAKQLVRGVEDELEKAKIIHKYVQENTRYISVQVGIGGLQPISAIEVDRVKYGDCKGLSNYTIALLKAVGVEAYYVVVQAGYDKVSLLDDFADLGQGNHVIITIPYKEKYYWIDCTSQVHPFGFIGDFTDDRNVLVIKPDGGELVKTEAYLDETNYQKIEGNYTLTPQGNINANVSITTTGIQYDQHFVLENSSDEDVKDHYKDFWDNVNNLQVHKYEFENKKDKVVFTETVNFSASKYASFADDKMIFSANVFNNNQYVPKRYRNRKLPFEIQRGYLDEEKVTIKIPNGFSIASLPEAKKIQSKFGTYELSFEPKEDGSIQLLRKFLLKHGSYTKEEYADYRSFRRNIARGDNSKIILNTQ